MTRWVRRRWEGRQFVSREADIGYAPDPDWSRLPPFGDIVRTALGPDGIFRDENNRAYQTLFGKVGQPDELDADDLDDDEADVDDEAPLR
jgi:hypothetical protein